MATPTRSSLSSRPRASSRSARKRTSQPGWSGRRRRRIAGPECSRRIWSRSPTGSTSTCAPRRKRIPMPGKWLQAWIAVAGLAVGGIAAAADRPNILLVMSDDHSYPHVGCYGNPDIQTPHLDRLASQGLRCDRTYVACPQCVPSRAAIMSGRSPIAIQMTRFSAPLPASVKVFPELLKERAGYFAGVAGRTYHLDGAIRPPETKQILDTHNLQTFPKRLDYVKTSGARKETLSQYREFLDRAPPGKPFVLQLCFSDPHRRLDRDAIPRPHDPAKLHLPAHYPDTSL